MKFKEGLKIIKSLDYFILSLKFLLPALLIFFITLFTDYTINVNRDNQNLLNKEKLNVELIHNVMSDDLAQLVTDIKILSDSIDRHIFKTDNVNLYNKKLIEQFISFSNIRRIYDQIRILDLQGNEVVRVNYDNGNAFIVPKSGLQNKVTRYYFKNIIATPKNSIYISPLDLNMENNVIEIPQQPTLRFGTPLYNSKNKLIGVLILNYNGFHLLNHFIRTADQLSDNIMLVAPNGFWVISPQRSKQWEYMTKENQVFGNIHPDAWAFIETNDREQLTNPKGIYTFATINNNDIGINQPLNNKMEIKKLEVKPQSTEKQLIASPYLYHWKVISFVDKYAHNAARRAFYERNKFFYLIFLVIIAIASIIITYWRVKHIRSTEQVLFERHFKTSLENIQLAAITLDSDGNILFCNHYFLTLSGLFNQTPLNQNWIELFVVKSQQERIRKQLREIVKTQDNTVLFECNIQTKTNQSLSFSWNTTMAVDAVGKVFGITLIGKNITKEKETAERLNKLSTAVEQSPNTVLITNLDGSIDYVNPKFTQLTGYTLTEIKGQQPSILKSGETSSKEYKALWETIKKGETWTGVFHNKKKSGEFYWEATAISALRDENGKITHYIAVKEDITEQRRLQQDIEEKTQELIRNKELATVGRMANMIAHDIRNPLSTIKMGLQIISRKDNAASREEEQELVQISLEQIRYMEEILSDLLSYSRPDDLHRQWLAVDKLIQSSLSSLHKIIESSQVNLTLDIQKGLPTVFTDQTKMRQVLSNLIQNAIQATETNKSRDPMVMIEASLSLSELGTCLEIEIKDNGCGIDKDKIHTVFDPFITTRTKGTGLGLAIVARIVKQHDGTVTLINRRSAGVIAKLTLPINPQQKEPVKAEKNDA